MIRTMRGRNRLFGIAVPLVSAAIIPALAVLVRNEVHAPSIQSESVAGAFVAVPVIDVGAVPRRHERTATFKLANRGSAPLKITQILAQCGCTEAKASAGSLQPGDVALIECKLNAGDISTGPFDKLVTVYVRPSQDPANHPVQLHIRGEIVSEANLWAYPGHLDLGEVPENVSVTRHFFIRGRPNLVAAFPMWIILTNSVPYRIDLPSATSGSGLLEKEIEVAILPTRQGDGKFESSIVAFVGAEHTPQISVSVSATAVGDVVVSPRPPLYLTTDGQAILAGPRLTLQSRHHRPLVVSRVSCDLPLKIRKTAGAKDGCCSFTLALSEPFTGELPRAGAIRVQILGKPTDIPVVIVPLHGWNPGNHHGDGR